VPAVAVIRKRQVLFIFNRFKGYLDGIISPKKGTIILEFYRRRKYLWRRVYISLYLRDW